MSRVKLSFLVIGLLAVVAVVVMLNGTSQLNASSTNSSEITTASTESSGEAKTAEVAIAGDKKSCPSSAAKSASDCSKKCSKSCASACGAKSAKTAGLEEIKESEGKRIVLVGQYVCGYCDLKVSDKCQAAFQTKDGKNYLLAKNNLSKQLRDEKSDKNIEIVTSVRKYDGVKYLEVEVVRPVS